MCTNNFECGLWISQAWEMLAIKLQPKMLYAVIDTYIYTHKCRGK